MSSDFLSQPQPAGDRFVEARTVPRFPLVAEIEVFEPIERTKLTASTTEIAAKGCYVRTPTPLQRNTVIQVQIQKNGESFKTWGRVAHAKEGSGMGIAFFRPEPSHEKTLQAWLATLKIEQSSHQAELPT